MNKEWFVFKGTHHLGPFTIEEMVRMFHNKEIHSQTLVWKEGATKWDAFSRCVEFSFLFAPVKKPKIESTTKSESKKPEIKTREEFDLPPPLPDLPPLPESKVSASRPSKAIENVLSSSSDEDELPPPIPLEVIIGTFVEKKAEAPKISILSHLKNIFLVLGVLCFVAVLVWFWHLQEDSDVQIRIRGIMPVYLERLELNATEKSKSLKVALALSLDGKVLWASVNKDSTLESQIKLYSIPKRVLGSEDVVVSVKGKFQNYTAKFDRMTLQKGSKFLPGEYRFEVVAREVHFINQKFKQLSAFPIFRALNSTHNYEGRALIYSGTPRDFEKRINDYQNILAAELLKPYQEKLERIQTLESLLNATSQNFLMELERAKNVQAFKIFEKKYIKEIAPVLQSLVLKALELSKDPKFNESDVLAPIAPYREQVILGKQIGEMVSETLTKVSKKKTLNIGDKLSLKSEFERKSKAIKLQIDLNLKKLEDEIKKISKTN